MCEEIWMASWKHLTWYALVWELVESVEKGELLFIKGQCSWMQVRGPAADFEKAFTSDKTLNNMFVFHKANFLDVLFYESISSPCDDDFSRGILQWNVNIYRDQGQINLFTLFILNPRFYNLRCINEKLWFSISLSVNWG